MKAPDKIYINGFSAFATVPVKDGIEYIRKDALMEWLQQGFDWIKDTVISVQQIIDKLNSL